LSEYWVRQAQRLDAIMTPQKLRTLTPHLLETLVAAIDSLVKKVLTPENGEKDREPTECNDTG
jgi:hypothetical protein